MVNRKDIEIKISTCDECDDSPLCLEAWYNSERMYGIDIRPEEYDELKDKIDEIVDISLDMIEHEQCQNMVD